MDDGAMQGGYMYIILIIGSFILLLVRMKLFLLKVKPISLAGKVLSPN